MITAQSAAAITSTAQRHDAFPVLEIQIIKAAAGGHTNIDVSFKPPMSQLVQDKLVHHGYKVTSTGTHSYNVSWEHWIGK
jgi:hypothetical protein